MSKQNACKILRTDISRDAQVLDAALCLCVVGVLRGWGKSSNHPQPAKCSGSLKNYLPHLSALVSSDSTHCPPLSLLVSEIYLYMYVCCIYICMHIMYVYVLYMYMGVDIHI